MYELAHIDFSNHISLSEPLPDEIDRQDQLKNESASSLASDLEKAVFGAA